MSPNSIYFSDDALGDTVAMWTGLKTEKSGSDGYRTNWVDGMYDANTFCTRDRTSGKSMLSNLI